MAGGAGGARERRVGRVGRQVDEGRVVCES
jgi:hypothetical protein